MAFLALPRGPRPPRLVAVAAGALAAYAAWSYLAIAWADQQGDAWDGANRTALYAAVFALFALWPIRGRPAAVLVGVLALAVAGIALVELLKIASAADPGTYFHDGRLIEPVGYVNANAALWSMAFFPCVAMAARREVAPALRGLFAGSAVLLAGVALMSQSRGWLFALPVVFAVFLAVTPRRIRTAATLLVVLAGVGVTIPAILDVYEEENLRASIDDAARAIVLSAVVVGGVVGIGALADRRTRPAPATERLAGRALGILTAGALALGVIVYVAERGSPFTDIADAWEEFKTAPTPTGDSSRLVGQLGSNRYDFWRVAWNEFEGAPLAGIGTDNFQQAYLRDSRSHEEPRYPHSVELRALAQTGLIGTVLLAVGLGAALLAASLALRRRPGIGAAAAAGAIGTFAYWFVHGSVDWFWEFPALGAAAFAMLGLAAGLAPRRPDRRPSRRRRPLVSTGALPGAMVAAVALAYSFGAPWLSEQYVQRSAKTWPDAPGKAFDRLDSARGLNPLSPRADLIAGAIALRLDDLDEAEDRFRQALEREPTETFSHLELGAILVNTGRRREGIRHLARAHELHPRDSVTARALRRARRGQRIDIARMNDEFRARVRRLAD